MATADDLREAARGRQWEKINAIFDQSFFALLLTDPSLVREVIAELPEEWYEQYPRHVMTRGIANTGSVLLVDAEDERRFGSWVEANPQPLARDQIGELMSRMRVLVSIRRFAEAEVVGDQALSIIHGATESFGFTDVLMPVLLRIGRVKLMVGKISDASRMFIDAYQWANAGPVHPIAPHVRSHLALIAALNEDFAAATDWLQHRVERTIREPGLRYSYESVGLVACALSAVGHAEPDTARVALDDMCDESGHLGELWWLAAHARARYELFWGDPYAGITLLRRYLHLFGSGATPAVAQTLLHADLASLFLMADDISSAERALAERGIIQLHPAAVAASIRLHLARGHADAIPELLEQFESASSAGLGATLAVLAAQAELEEHGAASDRSLHRAAFTVRNTGARVALLDADQTLRLELVDRAQIQTVVANQEFPNRSQPSLTKRESQVLHELRRFDNAQSIANELYISPNTVKAHLQSLYKKLGVHSREQALRRSVL